MPRHWTAVAFCGCGGLIVAFFPRSIEVVRIQPLGRGSRRLSQTPFESCATLYHLRANVCDVGVVGCRRHPR